MSNSLSSTPSKAAKLSAAFRSNFAFWIEGRPRQAFAGFLALHFAVWTALPALLWANLPLDIIEGLVFGREWHLGYYKLPPLPWWILELAYRLVGSDAAYYALSQIAVLAAFVAVWATARPLVGEVGALVAILIVDGLNFFTYSAPEFNHNVIQLPLWALAGYALWSGLRHGRMLHWATLGVAVGVAFWAKYFVLVLAVPIAVLLLVDHDARRALRTPGPWVAAAIALLIATPHVVWLYANDFAPLTYTKFRSTTPRGALDHLLHPLTFAAIQAGFFIPAIAIAAPIAWPHRTEAWKAADAFDRRIITWLTFGPAATLVISSVVSGRGLLPMWAFPMWSFLGLWILMVFGAIDRERLARTLALWSIVFAAYVAAFLVNFTVLPGFRHPHRVSFPGERLAAELTEKFEARTGEPLAYVIGHAWPAGNIEHYSSRHPRALVDGDPRKAPWIDLADLKARGALVVWMRGDRATLPHHLAAVTAGAQVEPPIKLPVRRGTGEVEIGWAIVPPTR